MTTAYRRTGVGGPELVPAWLHPIREACLDVRAAHFTDGLTPPDDGSARDSAVLMLFGETEGEPDVLLIERSMQVRSHPGQAAFPGGRSEPYDADAAATALREATEETGLDPNGVEVLATLPPLWVPVSNHAVAPVLAWWSEPSPVAAVDVGEVASVHRVRLTDLLDPAYRLQVRYPGDRFGPAFRVDGLFVWGFTAGLLSGLFDLAGLTKPWDRTRIEDYPALPGVRRRGTGGS